MRNADCAYLSLALHRAPSLDSIEAIGRSEEASRAKRGHQGRQTPGARAWKACEAGEMIDRDREREREIVISIGIRNGALGKGRGGGFGIGTCGFPGKAKRLKVCAGSVTFDSC